MGVEDARSPSRMRVGPARSCPAILGAFSAWHPLSASCIYSKRERYSRYSKAASSALLGHSGESPCGRVYVMTPVRITVGINKAEGARKKDAQNSFADALRWVFPTPVSSSPISRAGPPGDSCDRSSVTFDLRQCALPALWRQLPLPLVYGQRYRFDNSPVSHIYLVRTALQRHISAPRPCVGSSLLGSWLRIWLCQLCLAHYNLPRVLRSLGVHAQEHTRVCSGMYLCNASLGRSERNPS